MGSGGPEPPSVVAVGSRVFVLRAEIGEVVGGPLAWLTSMFARSLSVLVFLLVYFFVFANLHISTGAREPFGP